MGIMSDLGILVGVLPIPNLEFEFNKKSMDEKEKINCEKLNEFNGKSVWIRDFHEGILSGTIKYIPLFQDKYFLSNYNNSGESKMLHIHDLETIF